MDYEQFELQCDASYGALTAVFTEENMNLG